MRALRIAMNLAAACLAGALCSGTMAQNRGDVRPAPVKPPRMSRCDISIPLRIEMIPLNEPRVGQVARFRIEAGFSLDPDLVRNSWIEYELPERLQQARQGPATRNVLGNSRAGRAELGVVVPDARRYEIRARYVVQLTNGRTIGRTVVRQINPENLPPEGMIGRVEDSKGHTIRLYRGVEARN